ncbi:MAG: riboflavin synthase [Fibrobacterota bacterium]
MFTGLIECLGTIAQVQKRQKSITLGLVPDTEDYAVAIGDSVAINGVCLTLESISGKMLFFTAVYETLRRTNLIDITSNQKVNLERALRLGDRLDGHIVQGHVDGVGRISHDKKAGVSLIRRIWIPPGLRPFMALKGSVAIDGISLTIAESTEEDIAVSLIPHTIGTTTMDIKRVGDLVNVECDVLARYIFQLLRGRRGMQMLSEKPPEQSSKDDQRLLSLLENLGF